MRDKELGAQENFFFLGNRKREQLFVHPFPINLAEQISSAAF